MALEKPDNGAEEAKEKVQSIVDSSTKPQGNQRRKKNRQRNSFQKPNTQSGVGSPSNFEQDKEVASLASESGLSGPKALIPIVDVTLPSLDGLRAIIAESYRRLRTVKPDVYVVIEEDVYTRVCLALAAKRVNFARKVAYGDRVEPSVGIPVDMHIHAPVYKTISILGVYDDPSSGIRYVPAWEQFSELARNVTDSELASYQHFMFTLKREYNVPVSEGLPPTPTGTKAYTLDVRESSGPNEYAAYGDTRSGTPTDAFMALLLRFGYKLPDELVRFSYGTIANPAFKVIQFVTKSTFTEKEYQDMLRRA